MRKPLLAAAGVCLGLLFLATSASSTTHDLHESEVRDEGQGWMSSASDLLHRVKRQFNWGGLFGTNSKTTTEAPTTESGVIKETDELSSEDTEEATTTEEMQTTKKKGNNNRTKKPKTTTLVTSTSEEAVTTPSEEEKQVTTTQVVTTIATTTKKKSGGIFSLFGGTDDKSTTTKVPTTSSPTTALTTTTTTTTATPTTTVKLELTTVTTTEVQTVSTKKRGGLFGGGLFGGGLFDSKKDPTTEGPFTTGSEETEDERRYTRSTLPESVTPSLLSTDDEDLTNSGSGETGHNTELFQPSSSRKPRYYRISLMVLEPYKADFENPGSSEYRLFAQTLTQAINTLYQDVEGDQTTRVIKIQETDPFKIRVFLDLETVGNHDSDEIKSRIVRQINGYQRIGPYVVEKDIYFNEFGVCEDGEIPCKDGNQCIRQSARCDTWTDCSDGSDEIGCESVITATQKIFTISQASGRAEEDEDGQQAVDEDDIEDVEDERTVIEGGSNRTDSRRLVGFGGQEREEDQVEEEDDTRREIEEEYGSRNVSESASGRTDSGGFSRTTDFERGYDRSSSGERTEDGDRYGGSSGGDGARGESGYGYGGSSGADGGRGEAGYLGNKGEGGRYRGSEEEDEARRRYENRGTSRPEEPPRGETSVHVYGTTESRRPDSASHSGRSSCRADDSVRCASDHSIYICTDQECDGVEDCPGGSDETNCDENKDNECGRDEFVCDRTRCIFATQKCDGTPDCIDGTDEADCEGHSGCDFRCKDGTCLSYPQRCNYIKECPEGEDELDCHGNGTSGQKCPPGDFACRDGSCISDAYICDKVADCADGSDEQICGAEPTPPGGSDGTGLYEPDPPFGKPCDGFTCDDGSCVETQHRCDGKIDCDDGTDEDGCASRPEPSIVCLPGQVQCRDESGCYNVNETCNSHLDCTDGSDEEDCPCKPDQFRCRNGWCIPGSQRCNDISECPDRDDEEGCRTCPDGDFTCNDKRQCISQRALCDGFADCSDGEDELGCKKDGTDSAEDSCEFDSEFRCNNGNCILQSYRCDGIADCTDNSDEENCTESCGPRDHVCKNGSCIKDSKVCDSYVDCPDGSDEENCHADCLWTEFKCDSGECIPNIDRCNRRPDCRDGSDEANCPSSVECNSFQFKCRSDNQCVHRNLQCDGRRDCRDGSDESGCPPRRNDSIPVGGRCGPNEFKCLSGNQCIDRSQFCDGLINCSDRSDEENCDSGPALNLRTYPAEQTIKESREVVFQCRDEGPGHIPVRWSRGDGLPLPPNSRDHRGRLEMPNIQLAHSGQYFCEAIGVPRNSPGAKVPVYLKVEPFTVPTPYTPVCRQDQATCHNRECIPKHKVCDGVHDCGDGSDESRCSPWGCEPNEFRCDNKKCVRKSWLCDKDDDCGDGSDERNCQKKLPGALCFMNEFECSNRKMCIPKWFHCDSHNDCHDGSDEIGCYPIKIVNVSKPLVMVEQGHTLTLSCSATGVPTPIISWRLNWHHVPSKCRSINDDKGSGTLSCPDMQESDQGAYTCEALDFRNSILAPDTHVVVQTSGTRDCPAGTFSTHGGPDHCTACFCFGATTDCSSSDQLYMHTLRPTIQNVRFVNVHYNPSTGGIDVRTNEASIVPQSSARVSVDNVVQVVSPLVGKKPYEEVYPYLALPESVHGNQLKSYGGTIQYKVKFTGPYYAKNLVVPVDDIIIVGNGYTLEYNVTDRMTSDRENEVSVNLSPGGWRVASTPRGQGSLQKATREDIMMALQNVENILIKFQYVEADSVETTISDIKLDTASIRDTGRGASSSVEQCRCPAGYSGYSCESCAAGYMRSREGLWLGRCERYEPEECRPGTYGDPSRRIPCQPCPCPLTTPSNQFGRSCRLDSDDQPTCDCPAAYTGRRCESCAPGYTGNPLEPNGYCSPVVEEECDPAGSYYPYSDPATGICDCKAHTTGDRCDQCKPDAFALSVRHQHGCIDCFCMGITSDCTSSSLYRDQVKAVFNSGTMGFTIAKGDDYRDVRNVTFDPNRREIMYNNFDPMVYYWVVPARFLGDKVTSYGGNLKYTLRYVPTPGGQSSRNNAPDVEIRSLNNYNLVHRSTSPPDHGVESTITVPILEQHWTREDGGPVNRPHLLMALADLSAIYIKATYTTNTVEAGLVSVSIDTASSRNTGSFQRAVEVEQCRCPPGYIGTSCEDCDAGYTRTEDGLYLRVCEPCSCSNHSNQCHPDTGNCENCGDNTAGSHCENCMAGFVRGSDGSCRYDGQPCDCDERGITGPCTTGRYCQCKVNVIGGRCDRCRSGTFGLTESRPEGCFECYCSGLTDQCQSSNMYREKIPTLVIDDEHGFTIFTTASATTSLKDGSVVRDGFSLDYARNEIGYNIARRPGQRLFWSLPSQLTGDKVTSYGGKLSFKLRYTGPQDLIEMEPDTHIILLGNGITLFRHFSDEVIKSNYPKLFEVQLIDDGHWKILSPTTSKTEASRIDLLKALSGLEKILILATFGDGIETTHISDVAMDTAVPARGGDEAMEVEVCRCPIQYKGTSCQECNEHYYRHYDQTCHLCPCNGNEESCSMGPTNQVRCNCRPGFYGTTCESTGYPTPPPPFETPDPPTIVITITQPTIRIVEVGNTVRYNCSAISRFPSRRVNVNWMREGGILPSKAIKDRGVLIIPEVREIDSGVYICTANDGYRSHSQSVTLTVGGSYGEAPSVRILPASVDAKIGDPLELTCEASGSPRPSLSWRKLDEPYVSPYGLQLEGIFRIDSLRREDEGYYECTASNRFGSEVSTVHVKLREPSTDSSLTISPWKFSGLEGDTVYLTCSSSRNIYRLSWSRQGGRQLPANSKLGDRTLTIYNARSTDQGVYVCTAYEVSSNRQVSETEVTVEIGDNRQPAPGVLIEPDKQTVPQGSSAMIRCTTSQPGVRIRWSKREDTIPPHIQVQGGILRIPAVHVTDRGMYICTVEYASGQLQKYAILEVEPREAPMIELHPRVLSTLLQGSSMLIQCRATGIPPPNIYWSRPNNQSIPYNIQQLPNGVLRLNSVQLSDAGQYVCHAENTAGSTTATANVKVNSVPAVKISPRGPINLQTGQLLKLECTATGYPQPFVSWSRHRASSRALNNLPDGLTEPSYNSAVYDIYSVSYEDEGLYICSARNDAGTTEERVEVIVNDDNTVRPDVDYPQPPQVDVNDPYIPVMWGESTQINCQMRNREEHVTTEWVRADGRPLPEGAHQRDGVLYLSTVNQESAGEYICMVIDKETKAVLQQKRTLVVVSVPPRITLTPQRQVVRVGDNARIQCSAQGEQPISINWEAVDRAMPPSVSTQQGYLLFQGIQVSDAGKYVCKARNAVAESQAVAEVIVNEESTMRPIVTAIDRKQTVSESSRVELQCSADITARMEWTREGPEGLPVQAIPRGNSLILDYANQEDSGRYRCTVISPSGTSSSDYIDLTVNRAQTEISLTIEPSIDVIRVGNTVDLRCIPSGVPRSQLSWTRVGDSMANNVHVLENVLRITDVTTRNSGIYRCSARTQSGLKEKDFILRVQGDDEYDGTTTNGAGDNNDNDNNVNDDYDDNGNYDNGDDGDNNGDDDINNGDDDINNGDDDINNGDDNGNGSTDEIPETPTTPAVEVKSADAGKTIVIQCKTTLEPPVSYKWSKFGQELKANTHQNQSALTLSNLGESDAGLYLCVASNGQVRMEIPTVLTVTGLIPSFHQKPISYVAMPMLLGAHLEFDIEITFKPQQPDGMIMYNGQEKSDGDFISFGLKNSRPEFRFEVGSGPAVITTDRPVRLNQWHTVRLTRNKREGEMWINGEGPLKGTSPGRYQGLDLDQPMYLGSVPEFDKINVMNGFSSGFVGCISELKIGGDEKPITKQYAQEWEGIGDCDSCRENSCENSGACQQARNKRGFVCICPRGFSDENCTKLGESCYTGACGAGQCVEADRGIRCKCPIDRTGDRCETLNPIKTPQFSSNSYIAYPLQKSQQKLKMAVMFKAADDSDGLLLYSSQDGTSHFASLAIKNKHLQFLYDNGYGLTQVRSTLEVTPGEWEVVTIGADELEAYLNFHEFSRNSVTSRPGVQRSVVGSHLYLGGVDPSVRLHPTVGVRKGFNGCISSIDVHGQSLNVLWSAQEAAGITECSAKESSSSVSCRPNTCKNNGACSIKNNRVTCSCRPGYSGPYCELVEDVCATSSPCENGGTCEKSLEGNTQCLCPPGLAGNNCQHRLDDDVSFSGNGYIELEADLMQHDDPMEPEVIEIEFTTTSADGLLLWQGQLPGNREEFDYLSIAVVDGQLQVGYELGSGPALITVDGRVDDGERHTAKITRTATEAQVTVDSKHEVSGSSSGYLSKLNTPGNIFIGGAPDVYGMTSGNHYHSFSGCIHRLRLPYVGDIDFVNQPLHSLNALPCSNTDNSLEDEDDSKPTRGDTASFFNNIFK